MTRKLFIGLVGMIMSTHVMYAQKGNKPKSARSTSAIKENKHNSKKVNTTKIAMQEAVEKNKKTTSKNIAKQTDKKTSDEAIITKKQEVTPIVTSSKTNTTPEVITSKPKPEAPVVVTKKADSTQSPNYHTTSATDRIVKKKPVEEIDPSSIYANGLRISKNKFGEDYAQYISDYVQNYHNNFGSRMSRIKTSNRKYFSLIENIMRKHGIPKEFKSLCVIESGLNPNAVSPVGAVGPWQFMEPTAKNMGLRVDEELDERRDFYKSTVAAAKFCKRLNGMFDDWLLVVASYNCGPAPVIRALNNTGGNSFWDIKKYLPKETQNHVMAFIATSAYYDKNTKVLEMGNFPTLSKSKMKNIPLAKNNGKDKNTADEPEELPIPPPDPNDPQITEAEMKMIVSVKLKGGYNIETISEVLDVDVTKLRRWNPGFNEKALASKESFKLILPSDKVEDFIIAKEDILKKSLKTPHPTSVEPPRIANAVNLRARLAEKEREKQKIEQAKKQTETQSGAITQTTSQKETLASNKEAKPKKYTVKEGDNLNNIAEQFGMTVARLMTLNKLTTSNIKVGHTLYLE